MPPDPKTSYPVAVVRYQDPLDSLRKAVDLTQGLEDLTPDTRVFIKPNIVFWTRHFPFPKWGVITTSHVVEGMVRLLKERGIRRITLGEGTVLQDPNDRETLPHAFKTLGYETLKKRYGITLLDVFQRPFKKVPLAEDLFIRMNTDALESDCIVNLPVMKTHAQTVVSLGIKNLKGLIDIPSRKKCHGSHPVYDLHFMVSRLADVMPPMFTLIDGIFTNERGPGPDGKIRRSNLLVASRDVLSADLTAAAILGYTADRVPHLMLAAKRRNRPADLTDIRLLGEPLHRVTHPMAYDFEYIRDEAGNVLPKALLREEIRGISFRKYDTTLCTYCSALSGLLLTAIREADRHSPFDSVEILTGKAMEPTPGKKKTILLGKCMVQKNRRHPAIRESFQVKSCPPRPAEIAAAFSGAGIPTVSEQFADPGRYLSLFDVRYRDNPDFDASFFQVR